MAGTCIILGHGHKILGCNSPGVRVGWLTNHIPNNFFVKDTGDTTGAYTVVADGGTFEGSDTIIITGTNGGAGHGLAVGQVIELTGGAYDGKYSVVEVPSTTTFRVRATFAATDAANWALFPGSNKIIGTSNANGQPLTFFRFEQELESAGVAENFTGDRTSGTGFWEQNISFVLFANKDQALEDQRRTIMNQLIRGRFQAVVEDNSGVKRFYGTKNGLKLPEGESVTGVALGDLAGFTFTLQGKEPEESYIYDDTGDDSGAPAEAFTAFTLPA
jgi:hypothetical protein